MTGAGPQRYPGASTAYWWQTRWGGDPMEVNALVLHTTEGTALPDYQQGAQAPNLTAIPDMKAKRLVWYQHFDIDRSSRALVNAAGGVETNTLNVTQVELGGTCDAAHRGAWGSKLAGLDYVYWPEAPDWALQGLAAFVAWLHANHKVPLVAPPVWLAYGADSRRPGVLPASYCASSARMTPAQWDAFKGVCGHSHVPENDHGDPGSLPITKLLAMAAGTYKEDTTMAAVDLAPAAAAPIIAGVWNHQVSSPTAAEGTDPARRMGDFLRYGADAHYAVLFDLGQQILTAVQDVPAVALTDDQVQALGTQIAGQLGADTAFADRVAELLVEKTAARLAD